MRTHLKDAARTINSKQADQTGSEGLVSLGGEPYAQRTEVQSMVSIGVGTKGHHADSNEGFFAFKFEHINNGAQSRRNLTQTSHVEVPKGVIPIPLCHGHANRIAC